MCIWYGVVPPVIVLCRDFTFKKTLTYHYKVIKYNMMLKTKLEVANIFGLRPLTKIRLGAL